MKKTASIIISVIISIITAVFILSSAIAVPILIRPFYYSQIDSLGLTENTGYSRQQIIDAYDETLNYCTGLSDTFGTGILKWSESGKSHFDDVKALFILDIRALISASVILIIFAAICIKTKYRPYRFFGHTPYFYSGAGLISAVIITGVFIISDFDRAFNIFHTLFFPGKDNWIFDEKTDQIILILPEQFFYNCALIIIAVIILMCCIFITADIVIRKHRKIKAQIN